VKIHLSRPIEGESIQSITEEFLNME
jgi:hypothetical protein